MKKLAFLLVLLVLLVLLALHCERNLNAPDSDTTQSGAYSYTAYNTENAAVVSGWFTIEPTDSTAIRGEWHFQALGDTQHLGPQIGDGLLVGTLENNVLSINLNPDWVDNNVVLNGTRLGNRFDGTWMWITIAGPWTGGSFKAVKK